MAAIAFDLNEPPPPELDLNETIDWMSSLDDCHESPAHKLDYDGDEEGRGNEDEENGDGGEDVAGGDEQDDQAGLEAQVHAGDEHAEGVLMQDLSLGTPCTPVLSASESYWFPNLVHDDAELSTHCMMLNLVLHGIHNLTVSA
ncbi:Os01g0350500 [Oryza sativa Japonica Group]|uniref:Os01g0350500 protein n=1 Tax=Oryza sativa subsp. japonica TaxID=39947 RepID=C7IXZ4_ORYSJ|nr:Os01g0350500 [Oryza sativa Japonica Group]|eukprot:NP_001172326.1 Os01g0350500 [Oryza sativa Japonica Group]